MAPPKQNDVLIRLKNIESNKGVKTLFAVLTGSRMYGLNGPDSDIDVRFIYAHEPKEYLRVQSGPYEPTIEKHSEDIDLSGWSIQKALRLMGKSNMRLMESLIGSEKHPDQTYVDTLAMNPVWNSYPDFYDPYTMYRAYKGVAKSHYYDTPEDPSKDASDFCMAIHDIVNAYYLTMFRDQNGIVVNLKDATSRLVKDAIGPKTANYVRNLPDGRYEITEPMREEVEHAIYNNLDPENVSQVETPEEEKLNELFRKVLTVV